LLCFAGHVEVSLKWGFEPRVTLGGILSEQNLELLMGQFYTSTTLMYSRGILNRCRKCKNPRIYALLLYVWDNFKPFEDEWIMKGHTHRNEPRIM